MICEECKEQGLKSNVYPNAYSVRTAMCANNYYDSEGKYHHHDANSTTQGYNCSNGHQWSVVERGSCWCGWRKENKE
jgi:hypothetical protein